MTTAAIPRPEPSEYVPYYETYLSKVPKGDLLTLLEDQRRETQQLLSGLSEAKALHRYAPGKWSIKEVVGHLMDTERVFCYRALAFGRADANPLPGFDEKAWVPPGRFDARPLKDLAAELDAVRRATIALFSGLDADALERRGTANNNPITVRALAWIIVGHGRSSRPSDGLRARFPRYAYEDMVTAQYRLVTDGLHVNHLLLVMGTSMGCMHSWLWAERYPDVMDGVVPLACFPTQIAGRNRMWRKMIIDDIRTDPDWKNGEYTTQPRRLRAALQLLFTAGSAPLVQQRLGPTRDSADAYITRWLDTRFAETDANDLMYQVDASRDYDPSTALDRITASVLAINSADDFINPPELGLMDRLIPRVKRARYVLIPTSERTRGHGTHTAAAVWKEYFGPFVAALERAQ